MIIKCPYCERPREVDPMIDHQHTCMCGWTYRTSRVKGQVKIIGMGKQNEKTTGEA